MALNWCGFKRYLSTVEKFEPTTTSAQMLEHYKIQKEQVQLYSYWLPKIEQAAKNASKTQAEYNTLMHNAKDVVQTAQQLFDKMHPL